MEKPSILFPYQKISKAASQRPAAVENINLNCLTRDH